MKVTIEIKDDALRHAVACEVGRAVSEWAQERLDSDFKKILHKRIDRRVGEAVPMILEYVRTMYKD